MSDQPVILVVDDELTSLSITEQELRKRYGADYRIVARQSATAALDDLTRFKESGQPVALVLADQWMARHVTILLRGDTLGGTMSHYLVTMLQGAEKVELRPHTTVVDGDGPGRLMQLTLEDRETGERETVPAQALFVMIGARPHTEWLPPAVARDEEGFVLTGPEIWLPGCPILAARAPALRPGGRSLPGVFAAGDVRAGAVKRAGPRRSAKAPWRCGTASSTSPPCSCVSWHERHLVFVPRL